MSENPVTQMPMGILFTRRELAYVDSGLARLSQDYSENDQDDISAEIESLRKRSREANSRPQGMPEERHTYWGQAFMLAIRDHGPDSDEVVQIVKNYWAELLRLETKPDEALAGAFAQVSSAFRQGATLGTIQLVGAKLAAADRRHPESQGLANELGPWLEAGEKAIHAGQQPWADDPDLQVTSAEGASSE